MTVTKSRVKAYFVVATVALVGFALAVFFILDADYFFLMKARGAAGRAPGAAAESPTAPPGDFSKSSSSLKSSVMLVLVMEKGTRNILAYGTGFVAQPGWVATNRHVVTLEEKYRPEDVDVVVVDEKKGEWPALGVELATPAAGKDSGDLAVIHIEDQSIPPLYLMDSAPAENGQFTGADVQTMGFGFDGTYDNVKTAQAAPLSKGVLSGFNKDMDLFTTSGLDARKGNSGGPVFLVRDGSVIGVVVAKAAKEEAGQTTFVIPVNRLRDLLKEVAP